MNFIKAVQERIFSKHYSKYVGEQALSRAAEFRWIAQFKDGRNEVVKKTSPGRPSCATDEDHVTKVREILDTDRRLDVKK